MDFHNVLFVSDFDHTLTGRDGSIPPQNVEAIRRFTAAGGLFAVGTGRSLPLFSPQLHRVPANAPAILFNGAACYDFAAAKLLFSIPMPVDSHELLRTLWDTFPWAIPEIQDFEAHRVFSQNPMQAAFYRASQCPLAHITLEQAPHTILKLAIFDTFKDSTTDQFFHATPEEAARIAQLEAFLNRMYGDRLSVVRSADRIIDLQAKQATKGLAARRLADLLGRKILACAGDAPNDLSMLQAADLAFLPADCDAALQHHGFSTTVPCGAGTIAAAIRTLEQM